MGQIVQPSDAVSLVKVAVGENRAPYVKAVVTAYDVFYWRCYSLGVRKNTAHGFVLDRFVIGPANYVKNR